MGHGAERPQMQCIVFWLFSIYSHRIFTGSGHRKQITICIINPNISLPPTGSTRPQSRATLPFASEAGASLPARQLQVMACEMTGLFVGREARWRPAQLIYGATVVFSPGLDTYKYMGKVSLLKQTMM